MDKFVDFGFKTWISRKRTWFEVDFTYWRTISELGLGEGLWGQKHHHIGSFGRWVTWANPICLWHTYLHMYAYMCRSGRLGEYTRRSHWVSGRSVFHSPRLSATENANISFICEHIHIHTYIRPLYWSHGKGWRQVGKNGFGSHRKGRICLAWWVKKTTL